MVHHHPGATSTNSSSLFIFLSIFFMHGALRPYSTEDMRSAHLARSSFLELQHKSFHSLLQSLALSSASLTRYAQSNYNYHLHLAPIITYMDPFLHRLDIYLYITKSGLNMGKTMGRHPHTRYISPKPKIS